MGVGNRRRFLSEVVALDAWHTPIRTGRNSTAVSVELTFKQGRLGGDDLDIPFTFLLALRRATLNIRVEEPLTIDRRSVARDIPATQGEQTTIGLVRDKARSQLAAGVGVDLTKFVVAADLQGSAEKDISREKGVKFIQSIPKIMATGEPVDPQEYRWNLETTYQEVLEGQPWDPVSHPRLSAKYDPIKLGKLEPAIQVELRCRFEDLVVSNITPKDATLAGKLIAKLAGDTNLAAAAQYIKKLLHPVDLEAGAMDNRFASLVLGNVISASESDSDS